MRKYIFTTEDAEYLLKKSGACNGDKRLAFFERVTGDADIKFLEAAISYAIKKGHKSIDRPDICIGTPIAGPVGQMYKQPEG